MIQESDSLHNVKVTGVSVSADGEGKLLASIVYLASLRVKVLPGIRFQNSEVSSI